MALARAAARVSVGAAPAWRGRAQQSGPQAVAFLATKVPIVFVDSDGSEVKVEAAEGRTLLEVAHENDIELEGACDGSLACSTCHLIIDDDSFKKIPPPSEEELDMLDLAFDLQETCASQARQAARRRALMPSHPHRAAQVPPGLSDQGKAGAQWHALQAACGNQQHDVAWAAHESCGGGGHVHVVWHATC